MRSESAAVSPPRCGPEAGSYCRGEKSEATDDCCPSLSAGRGEAARGCEASGGGACGPARGGMLSPWLQLDAAAAVEAAAAGDARPVSLRHRRALRRMEKAGECACSACFQAHYTAWFSLLRLHPSMIPTCWKKPAISEFFRRSAWRRRWRLCCGCRTLLPDRPVPDPEDPLALRFATEFGPGGAQGIWDLL